MSDIDDMRAFAGSAPAPVAPPVENIQAPVAQSSDIDLLHQFTAPEMKYEGAGNAVKAAGLSALSAGTLGLSDLAHVVSPEERVGLQQAHPIASFVGAGLGGGALIAATGGAGAAGEAIAGGAGLGASLIGGGLEGAAFGAGNSISDYALDPGASAEKLATNIGVGALLGIGGSALAHGAGGLLGKSGLVKGTIADTIENESTAANREAETSNAVGSNFKENTPEVVAAAGRLGLPVMEGMVSNKDLVQKGEDALLNGAPSYSSIRRKEMYSNGFNGVKKVLNDVVPENGINMADAGQVVQNGLVQKIQSQYEPIKQLYSSIKEVTPTIPLSERSAPAIARNILAMPEITQTPNSPMARLAQSVADNILNAKTVDDISFQKSQIRDMANSAIPGERRIAAILADKLDDWEKSSILRYADKIKEGIDTDPEMQRIWGPRAQQLDDLVQNIKGAKPQYKSFITDVGTLAEGLGKSRVHGPQDAIDFIKDLDFEQLTKRLTKNDNSQFRSWFAEKFPQEASVLQQYQKQAIRDAATKDGEFIPKAFFKKVNDLEPQIQKSIFAPDELQKINDAKTYLDSFPKRFNPSGTEGMSAFREFFESPTGATIANLRDFGIEQFIKHMGQLPDDVRPNMNVVKSDLAQRFNKLNAVQRISDRVGENVIQGIKSISGGAALSSAVQSGNSYASKTERIKSLTSNPEALQAHIANHVDGMYHALPNVSQAVASHIVNTVQFLNSKIATPPNDMPLSKGWEPSEAQKQVFNEYYSATNDPLSALKQIKNGELTSQTMEALQVCHPNLLQEMRSKMVSTLNPEKVKNMPLHTQEALSQFMGQPLSSAMLQPVRAANQMTFQNPAPTQANKMQMQGKTTAKGLDKLNIAQRSTGRDGSLERSDD